MEKYTLWWREEHAKTQNFEDFTNRLEAVEAFRAYTDNYQGCACCAPVLKYNPTNSWIAYLEVDEDSGEWLEIIHPDD